MRKLITIYLMFLCFSSQAQFGNQHLNFDSTSSDSVKYEIDTIGNPNNVWQVGVPNKAIFDSAFSLPNAILTDIMKPYPSNDTSSFLIYHYASNGFTLPMAAGIRGYYKCDSDSSNDYGIIEFSPDNGRTWVNLNLDSNIWYIDRQEKQPSFTGLTKNWVEFRANIGAYGPKYNIKDGDTVIYKFTFISDSISENRDGWMIDNINLYDVATGISENPIANQINIFPNPSSDHIDVMWEEQNHSVVLVEIFNSQGKLLYQTEVISTNRIHLDVSNLPKGMSILKLSNLESNKEYYGRFMKE